MKQKNTITLKKKQKKIKVFIFSSNRQYNNYEYIVRSKREYHLLTSIKLYQLLTILHKRGFKEL